MTNRSTVVLHDQWMTLYNRKPGLSRGVLNALLLCFPVSSIIWAGIIYAASKLMR